MSRTLFIGDSHTVGYKTIVGKIGPGSFTFWNDNNYAEMYSEINNKNVVIYAQPGATNNLYTVWLANMFAKYNDIDEVFLCLAPLNRITLSFDPELKYDVEPLDHFTYEHPESTEKIRKFSDNPVAGNTVQILQKPTADDYKNIPSIGFSAQHGLTSPDLRKDSYMSVKLFYECNTVLEKREFLLNMYAWDKICTENNAKLYVFNFRTRGLWPTPTDYFGKINTLKRVDQSVEQYLNTLGHSAEDYFIEDKEHFNNQYHKLIATEYLTWLKKS
jgi:hypothetical protein